MDGLYNFLENGLRETTLKPHLGILGQAPS